MKKNYERRFMWVKGKLKEVRSCWLWLFDFLNIGFVLPPDDIALKEVMQAAEDYHRVCQVYLRI